MSESDIHCINIINHKDDSKTVDKADFLIKLAFKVVYNQIDEIVSKLNFTTEI